MLMNEDIVYPSNRIGLLIFFFTTRFVTFTTQKPSDIQVMMLAVRSHANAKPERFKTQEAHF